MHILITGGTGFIGRALVPALAAAGHTVTVLSRTARQGEAGPASVVNELAEISDAVDGVINLAGASLAGRRWNDRYKQEIVDSRIGTTAELAEYFARAAAKPHVWINASAIGYYGPHGDDPLEETAPAGAGFAAQLCQDWEAAARTAAGEDCRVCLLRLGVVLDREGGAYEQMAQPFRFGIANWIGDGRQYLSWIHRDDVVRAILFLMDEDDLEGVFNLTAPEPVTSRGFCDAMRRVHRSLPGLPMPAWVMRAMVGEMADELLISGQRVVPARLQAAGFSFMFPDVHSALLAIEAP